ncbi:MAG: H4MPT-linked C1 transfer pathway protein [Betaproteobacteria bacterium]|nr:H4MPT-linked C1 transfer pathway protein [Betaproteobacteria bacterium]
MSDPVAMPYVIAWDVGGAHLKAVLLNADGMALAVRQEYCPLWRGLHVLEQAIDLILQDLHAPIHVVTMTGELADIFPNRQMGVVSIAQTVHRKLTAFSPKASVQYFSANYDLVYLEDVRQHSTEIASMNWLASVQFVACHIPEAIFVDIGSTTTDIAWIHEGRPIVRGFNDAQRMQYDELVYTGVVRTPLMALAQKILFQGRMVNVAAEHFATTADVYTLSGELQQSANVAETADGADKREAACARRIARMIGWDAEDAPFASWMELAYAFKRSQLNQVKQAIAGQLDVFPTKQDCYIVGAGVGEFLVKVLAKELGCRYVSVDDLVRAESEDVRNMAKVCFPAYALGNLFTSSQVFR